MGFDGKSTGRVTKASLWTPALAGSQQMLGDSHQQRASKSLSAPLVVGKQRPQEKMGSELHQPTGEWCSVLLRQKDFMALKFKASESIYLLKPG